MRGFTGRGRGLKGERGTGRRAWDSGPPCSGHAPAGTPSTVLPRGWGAPVGGAQGAAWRAEAEDRRAWPPRPRVKHTRPHHTLAHLLYSPPQPSSG